ncbi:type I-E CRISPR-associated protein Cse2/CasB [Candidatus Methylocalor cossyra]|uniref:CRISPR system Cascade subunit CasB n=1 Tax=Candidatus Methylocalor cossyra TaxID=3108543 RepID=A0ABM9NG94_9GAMM
MTNLVRLLEAAEFPPRRRAELRRMTPGHRPPLAFLQLAYQALPEHWEEKSWAWMTLVAGIALMCPDPHRADRPAGRVLAEVGLSEYRLEQLLSCEGEALHRLLLGIARLLGARRLQVNWLDFACLLLESGPRGKDDIRLAIARDFYRPGDPRRKKSGL